MIRPVRTIAAALAVVAACAGAQEAVVGGATNDYQASIVQPWNAAAARIVVFERLNGSVSGDLWATRSDDGGLTWSTPQIAVATIANERHAALVQTGDSGYALFHLSGGGSSFAIHRASSSDGATYTPHGAIDLGWVSGSPINPHVIRAGDGTLTMTYHLLGGASYIAQSADGGVTWDPLRTQVSPGNAQLPRIAYRQSDGVYLLVYQTGGGTLTLWVKTSIDPYDWSAPERQLTLDGNNHDAFPMVLPDGSFAILWARVANGGFQVFSTRSHDGIDWTAPLQHTDRAGLANIQPHALPASAPGRVELYWGAAQVPGDGNYDIVREPAVVVADVLFADDFESK